MTAPVNRHIDTHLIEMVKQKLILERISLNNTDVNQKDELGNNALFWAINRGSHHNASLLISFGSSLMVNSKTHALFHALECKQHELVVMLLDKGLDVNMTDNNGKTLLMYAIESEMYQTVHYLVDKGADLYLLDNSLYMAEDYANRTGNEKIITYFNHLTYLDNQASLPTNTCCCS